MRGVVAALLLGCASATTKPGPAAPAPVEPETVPIAESAPFFVDDSPAAADELGWECSSCDPDPAAAGRIWTLTLGRVDAEGAMHEGEVRRHVSLVVSGFEACFAAIHDDREVAFEFMLNHRGEVATVIEAEDASLASCVEARLRLIQFPAADGPTKVTFVLKRGSYEPYRSRDRDR